MGSCWVTLDQVKWGLVASWQYGEIFGVCVGKSKQRMHERVGKKLNERFDEKLE